MLRRRQAGGRDAKSDFQMTQDSPTTVAKRTNGARVPRSDRASGSTGSTAERTRLGRALRAAGPELREVERPGWAERWGNGDPPRCTVGDPRKDRSQRRLHDCTGWKDGDDAGAGTGRAIRRNRFRMIHTRAAGTQMRWRHVGRRDAVGRHSHCDRCESLPDQGNSQGQDNQQRQHAVTGSAHHTNFNRA
jgi:hypothetical protein